MPLGIPVSATPSAQSKVTIFYQYGESGISETLWTTLSPTAIRSFLLPGYTQVRMAFAVDEFRFLYARISNAGNPRFVDFVTPNDPGIVLFGSIGTVSFKQGSARGAADTSALLYRLKLQGGPSARMFLHGFDGSQDNEGTFFPNATFTQAIAAFLTFLKAGVNAIVFQYAKTVPLTSRLSITAINPNFPRGAEIQFVPATPIPPGQVITVGGVGSAMQGINGRKISLGNVSPANTSINVGGASPIGTYSGLGGYLYLINPLYGTVDYADVERLTGHRVGRPFAEPVGRRKNRLPLRR